jgi:hypothetical protein
MGGVGDEGERRIDASGEKPVKPRPALFRALGRNDPPAVIEIADDEWTLEEVFKHDSWAATGVYRRGEAQILCKFNRTQPIFGIPMRWLGRRLARRETGFMERLRDIESVPLPAGEVRAGGVVLENAAARIFIPGEAFRVKEQVTSAFIDELHAIIARVHAHDMAYVDLHKRENIIVGLDNRPYLIDFQVSYGIRPEAGWLKRAILRRLQEIDIYHLRKHHLRLFPETLTPEQIDAWRNPPGLINAHRRITKPLRSLRRKLLVMLGIRNETGMARSEFEPEISFREEGGGSGAGVRPGGTS